MEKSPKRDHCGVALGARRKRLSHLLHTHTHTLECRAPPTGAAGAALLPSRQGEGAAQGQVAGAVPLLLPPMAHPVGPAGALTQKHTEMGRQEQTPQESTLCPVPQSYQPRGLFWSCKTSTGQGPGAPGRLAALSSWSRPPLICQGCALSAAQPCALPFQPCWMGHPSLSPGDSSAGLHAEPP